MTKPAGHHAGRAFFDSLGNFWLNGAKLYNSADVDITTQLTSLDDLSAAELATLDAVTPGTLAASKAIVVNAAKHVDEINVASLKLGATGATVAVTATAAELNILDAAPASISFVAAAAGADVCEVTITVKDAAGVAIAKPFILDVWLSDEATGLALTAVTASGTVTPKAASGAVLSTETAKKHLRIQTLATGIAILEITDSAKTAFYVAAMLPTTGVAQVSAVLAAGNYGV